MTNEQIALLVSQAIELIDAHDDREGNSPELDQARAKLQEVCDHIPL